MRRWEDERRHCLMHNGDSLEWLTAAGMLFNRSPETIMSTPGWQVNSLRDPSRNADGNSIIVQLSVSDR